MPNLYATPQELKDYTPDGISPGSLTTYDSLFYRILERVSRWIDGYTDRVFYPYLDTRYFEGDGTDTIYIPDLISITSVSFSEDDGANYTDMETTDYLASRSGDRNTKKSYNKLTIALNGDYSIWPSGQDSVKIVGIWGHVDDRNNYFEDSGDAVVDNPLTAVATSLTLTDIDGVDKWGITPRVERGDLLRIEDEQLEVTATNTSTNVATVVRGVNGTTAAAHVQTTQVDVFKPNKPINEACAIQSWKQYKRGQAEFGNAVADIEMGRVMSIKEIDPEVIELLEDYRRLGVGL